MYVFHFNPTGCVSERCKNGGMPENEKVNEVSQSSLTYHGRRQTYAGSDLRQF